MRDFRHTVFILVLHLPPVRMIRPLQDRILQNMRAELEMKRQEYQRLRWQANQTHMELLINLDDPDYPPEKKDELRRIDRQLTDALDGYVTMIRLRIPEE